LHSRVSVVSAIFLEAPVEATIRCAQSLQDIFGKDKNPCRLVYGVASLPFGTPVELEVIFEVAN
jgi:hypothetical protein